MKRISPYLYPGLILENIDYSQHPYLKKPLTSINEHEVVAVVCNHFDTSPLLISSRVRKRHIVDARKVIAYIFRVNYGYTYSRIGKLIGNKDHATAIHNKNKFMDLYDSERDFRMKCQAVFKDLRIKLILD